MKRPSLKIIYNNSFSPSSPAFPSRKSPPLVLTADPQKSFLQVTPTDHPGLEFREESYFPSCPPYALSRIIYLIFNFFISLTMAWKYSQNKMNIREKGNIITFLSYLCIWVFIHTYTHTPGACIVWSRKPEVGIINPKADIRDSCELRCGSWKLKLDPLKEQQMLLIARPSLQPWKFILINSTVLLPDFA